MKPSLKFLGCGGAFNTNLGNNSAYWIENNDFHLVDCGGTVFSKIIEQDLLEEVDNINVYITHLHLDHVGSLGDLIFYCHYKLDKIVQVHFGNESSIDNLLSSIGVVKDMYYVEESCEHNYRRLKAKHVGNLECSSYEFCIGGKWVFYSGDTCEIPSLDYLKRCDEIYIEACSNCSPVHIDYDKLKTLLNANKDLKEKTVIMHADEGVYLSCGIWGFNSAFHLL